MPSPAITRAEIKAAVDRAKASDRERHSSFAEGALLNRFIIGHLHSFLSAELGFSNADAKRAILSESCRSHPDLVSGSPVRPGPHPFRKVIGASPRQIMEIWRGKTNLQPLARNSCPDLALRTPCPHRAVFEAKYLSSRGAISAEAELVKNIYQAFFYLGLPHLPETKTHAAWDYEYACVLAYDATADGVMVQAWESLPLAVKSACWTGANVYVMILRGSRVPKSV
jgi:hypothetical protein